MFVQAAAQPLGGEVAQGCFAANSVFCEDPAEVEYFAVEFCRLPLVAGS